MVIALFCFAGSIQAQHGFIRIRNGQFYLNGKPYRYIGTNMWYGPLLASQGPAGLRRLRNELDFLKANGVTNLRVMVGADGIHTGDSKIVPLSLQPKQGVYDRRLLRGLDVFMNEISRRGMYSVLYLGNSWDWSGGFPQYLAWNGKDFITDCTDQELKPGAVDEFDRAQIEETGRTPFQGVLPELRAVHDIF